MWLEITKGDLAADFETMCGLDSHLAQRAANYIFENEVNDGYEIIQCDSRDRWIEYLEIALEWDGLEDGNLDGVVCESVD